jgi:hypothetical protein
LPGGAPAQDNTPGSKCSFNAGRATRRHRICSANLLAPHLVLTAAHCIEPAIFRSTQPDCPNARLAAIVVCFNYNPGNTNPNHT